MIYTKISDKLIKFSVLLSIMVTVLFATTLISVIILLFISDKINIHAHPKRISSIPENAKWKGGMKGGYWFLLKDRTDSLYNFEIYDDDNGNLILNNTFVLCNECKIFEDSLKNVYGYINYFDHINKIYLTLSPDGHKSCYLIKINDINNGEE